MSMMCDDEDDVFRFLCKECVEERLKIKEAKNDS